MGLNNILEIVGTIVGGVGIVFFAIWAICVMRGMWDQSKIARIAAIVALFCLSISIALLIGSGNHDIIFYRECSYCETKIEARWDFCPSCGQETNLPS